MDDSRGHNIIQISADSIEQLRRCDVFRVLDSAQQQSLLVEMAGWIIAKRPDLKHEVDDWIGLIS